MKFEIWEKVTLNCLLDDVRWNSCFFYCKDLKPGKSKLYIDLNRDVFDKESRVIVTRDIHAMAILQFTTQ
jgi:hypothetical protein